MTACNFCVFCLAHLAASLCSGGVRIKFRVLIIILDKERDNLSDGPVTFEPSACVLEK